MKQELSNMMGLDIYLSSLDRKESDKIRNQIKPSITEFKPLLGWDVSIISSFDVTKKELDIQKIKVFAEKYKWKNDIDAIFLNNHFEAIVLTDYLEKILWVNEGFTKMTGYSKKFATNKQPSFLQGELTSKESRKEVKMNLQKRKPFKISVVNYKKDKTPYTCQVQIFPLYSNEVTHFMALETQVR